VRCRNGFASLNKHGRVCPGVGTVLVFFCLAALITVTPMKSFGQDVLVSSDQYKPALSEPIILKRSIRLGKFTPATENRGYSKPVNIEFACSPDFEFVKKIHHGNVASFIRKAFQDELVHSGVYLEDGNSTLEGEITEADVILTRYYLGNAQLTGTWQFSLQLNAASGHSHTFSSSHAFPITDTEFYCQEIASQFIPGVRKLVLSTLTDDEFGALLDFQNQ